MHCSINFHPDNIYLLNNKSSTTPVKSNYTYSLNNKGHYKIITSLNNKTQIDTVKIFNEETLGLNINTNWGMNNLDINIKNILIPENNLIELIKSNYDLNDINCLCQDQTFMHNLPTVSITINNTDSFTFDKWTGYNQTWTCIHKYQDHIAYSYMYIFQTKAILMSSIRKNLDHITLDNDLDIMSIYNYDDMSHDEFGRVDCNKIKFDFSDYTILNNPVNNIVKTILIETQYE